MLLLSLDDSNDALSPKQAPCTLRSWSTWAWPLLVPWQYFFVFLCGKGTEASTLQAPSSAALQHEEPVAGTFESSGTAEVEPEVAAEQAAAVVASRHLLTNGWVPFRR